MESRDQLRDGSLQTIAEGRAPVGQVNPPPDRCTVILILLSPIMLWMVAAHLFVSLRTASIATALSTIDPNTAPWYELSLLPRIGPSLAWEIVDHREAACREQASEQADEPEHQRANARAHDRPERQRCRPFRTAADLDAVRGIGPVTLQRIGPHLRFDDEPSATDMP